MFRGYEITMTDLMNVFYELDADRLGVVCLADFERLMLQLSFGPDAALRLFQRLDTDGDGALSLSDWTSEHSKTLAEMLCFRIIRQRLVGRNPIKAQMPTPSVSPSLQYTSQGSFKSQLLVHMAAWPFVCLALPA